VEGAAFKPQSSRREVMTTSQISTRKRYSFLVLAILLLLLGGVCLYLGSHNFQIRSLGLAAILASGYAVRIARAHDRPNLPNANGQGKDLRKSKGPSRSLWIVSAAMIPVLGVAIFMMCSDAVTDGGNATWPVDVFAWVAVVCTIVWSYLASKIVGAK
jgi:hypothetical protein